VTNTVYYICTTDIGGKPIRVVGGGASAKGTECKMHGLLERGKGQCLIVVVRRATLMEILHGLYCALLDPEDQGTMIFRNISN
jgi:hypothetical protein